MKRVIGTILVGVLLAGTVGSTVAAKSCAASLCVDATNKVNGSLDGGLAITYNTYATDSGTLKYNCWLGPIPFICDINFVQTFAYMPFGRPSVVAGNLNVQPYTIGTSAATGQYGWNYTSSGTITGDATAYLTGRALADTHTGSTYYWNATGTGKGHMIDDNYKNSLRVP